MLKKWTSTERRLALWVALATLAALLIWLAPAPEGADSGREAAVAPVLKSTLRAASDVSRATRPPANLSDRIAQLSHRTEDGSADTDLFGTQALRPPAPLPAPAGPPPSPVAPPFPYAFMGALQDGPVRTVFLTSANRVLSVKASDTIDGQYRIESITGDELVVTYLPLKQKQVISLKAHS